MVPNCHHCCFVLFFNLKYIYLFLIFFIVGMTRITIFLCVCVCVGVCVCNCLREPNLIGLATKYHYIVCVNTLRVMTYTGIANCD